MNCEETVRSAITEEGLIDAGDKVLVGVSGGIDSSTLLFVLHRISREIPFEIGIAHVNHGLRGEESRRDEAFVRDLALRYGIPCHVSGADVRAHAKRCGISLQHAGRDVRYAFFHETADGYGYNKIAVGHNRDDQVETFLLRVIKGTGISGLSSIPITRGRIIRPLLRSYRSEIVSYAAEHDIRYVEDSSNVKEAYERNFVRRRIMPLMQELNPQFREKILLLLSDVAGINAIFDAQAHAFLEREGRREEGAIVFTTGGLRALHEEVRFRVVSRALAELVPGFIALREHFLLVEKSLFSKRPNNTVTLPYGIKAKRVYDELTLSLQGAEAVPRETIAVGIGTNAIPLFHLILDVTTAPKKDVAFFEAGPATAYLDADRVGALSVRAFRDGDRFVPLGMKEKVKLKDYFIARKIPRERRHRLPLLLSGGDIVWIVGDRLDERYKVDETTQRVLRVTALPEQ